MKNPVSPEAAEQFAGYVEKWTYLLNLHDWRIIRNSKPAKGVCAQVTSDVESRAAVWRLGESFGTEAVTAQSLESTACHELLHVLLAEYRFMLQQRPGDDIVNGLEHRIVHTLERILVPVQ